MPKMKVVLTALLISTALAGCNTSTPSPTPVPPTETVAPVPTGAPVTTGTPGATGAPGTTGTPVPTGSPAPAGGGAGGGTSSAQTIYKSNCLSCHGTNMEGGVGPNLTKVGSKLSADQISTLITNGRGGMPAFKGRLSDADIKGLTDYLAGLK